MVQCPFCHYNNEDGALFCEQCKSDLAGVAVTVEAAAVAVEAMPMAEAMPVEAMPMEAMPVEAMPMEAERRCRGHAGRGDADGGHADGRRTARRADAAGGDAPGDASPSRRRPRRRRRLRRLRPLRLRRPTASAAPGAVAPPPRPPPPAAPAGAGLPPGAQPKLVVQRGQKPKAEYALFEGPNFVGRADEKPVDVDLEDQEPPDRVWSSRQHACIHFEDGQLSIEDLNSSNGTFVNRARIYPGRRSR